MGTALSHNSIGYGFVIQATLQPGGQFESHFTCVENPQSDSVSNRSALSWLQPDVVAPAVDKVLTVQFAA